MRPPRSLTTEDRMGPTLPPGRYRLLDRVTKLLAVVLLTAAIAPGALHGPLKLVCGIVAVVCGVLTVFVEPDDG